MFLIYIRLCCNVYDLTLGALPEINNDVIIREIHNSRLHMESK